MMKIETFTITGCHGPVTFSRSPNSYEILVNTGDKEPEIVGVSRGIDETMDQFLLFILPCNGEGKPMKSLLYFPQIEMFRQMLMNIAYI